MSFPYLPWNVPGEDRARPAVRDDRSRAVAAQFARHGVGPGSIVAIMLPNRVELLVAMLAAWRLGAAATPVNPAFTESEADYQISDSGAVLVINSGAGAPDGGGPSIAVHDLAYEGDGPDPVALRGDETSLVIYTSGSTGRPKGVMLDHDNAEAMSSMMARHFDLTADDHCMLVLPLFHVNAIMVSALAVWRARGQLSVIGTFSASRFFEYVEKLRPTYFSAVPAIYAMLAALPGTVRPDTSSLRVVVCGAAPVSTELLQRCHDRFGFVMVEGYGLTEATCASACNPVDGVRKLGTVGPALPGQRIGIMSAGGELLPPGTRGEVVVAGPTVMRGYLNRPDATADAVRDGWLHTGDIGVLDDDGYLRIVDRVKDMIIRGGENIYPKEIETVLTSIDDVLEAAVVGRPDPVLGEVPVAYVALYPDATTTTEDLLDHCRRHLMQAKIPEQIDLLDTLPKNPVGKIDKPSLRRSLQHT
ncbi:class I adenylate-forming enzyme family protein [Rhodococcus chondri]|uniref:AMP-binding protein n=1 Tax=Rhodococcus chondri TaxID=3065941 RepID=A0ABU7JXC3_9NOCA|nr:AMP-binding protein [Rhodococcus sp. CC-R104]MEE2034669.1 AMP-binding protein [Rhodococcus sp. CC-R104]